MAYTFDSLGYAKRLRSGGVPQEQAEAHAEAARDFIMVELASKSDLYAMEQKLQSSIAELRNGLDTQSLRLTIRLGVVIVVCFGVLGTILKLT